MENAGIGEKIRSASAFVSSRSDRDENWSDIPIKSQLCDIRRPGSQLQNIMDGRNAAARSSIITGTLRRIGRRKQTFSLSLFLIRRKYMRKDLPSESSVHIRWISSQKCSFFSYQSYVHDIGYLSVETNGKRYFIDLNVLYRDVMCLRDICGDTRYEVVSAHRYWWSWLSVRRKGTAGTSMNVYMHSWRYLRRKLFQWKSLKNGYFI